MNFKTTLPNVVPKERFELNYNNHLLFMGSCFSENIFQQHYDHLWPCFSNPFGVVYNPHSLAEQIERALTNAKYKLKDLYSFNSRYHSLLHHGKFQSPNAESLLDQINTIQKQLIEKLEKTDVIIISFGSAWCFKHLEKDFIVANCHKLPNSLFQKVLLPLDYLVEQYLKLVNYLKALNNSIKIVFTISPVRHLSYGFYENNLGKSTLFLLINEMLKKHNNCFYFPAYELINDDLRDYRFFKDDLKHPNQMAINYVLEYWKTNHFNSEALQLWNKISKLKSQLSHRPINENSEEHLKFSKSLREEIEENQKLYPFLDWANL